jgi:NTE family protein
MTDVKSEGLVMPARPIFAIFEGGGAKGIAHVGALQAIQDNGLEIVGVAGTSAGALVATLVSIGLEASDIIHADDPTSNILARYKTSPVEVLGEADWKRFERLLRHGKRALFTGAIVGPLLNFVLAPRVMTSLGLAVARYGHFSTDRIATFVNQVIRDRLLSIKHQSGTDHDVPNIITFRTLGLGWPTVIPLKIVVTDVDRSAVEVFDTETAPDVVVAEAVAASIAIPLVFRPARIPSFRPGRFADGGLVANFPVWTVAEEKLAYEREHYAGAPVPIVGFSLADATHEESPQSRLGYLQQLGAAALQGSQGAAARFLDDVEVMPLTTTLTLLDFDKSPSAYRDAFEAGRSSADRHLRFSLEVKPDRIRTELSAIRERALGLINARRLARGEEAVDQMRVNLITPWGQRSLRVVESVHMEADADDRLLLDRRGRGAAEAFRDRGLRVFRLGPQFERRDLEYMT